MVVIKAPDVNTPRLFFVVSWENTVSEKQEKAVSDKIDFHILRYFNPQDAMDRYVDMLQQGVVSVESLSKRGMPMNKVVVGRTSLYS